MARHNGNGKVGIDSHNIPPGTLGGLEQGMPQDSDRDLSLGPALRRLRDEEDNAVGLRRKQE